MTALIVGELTADGSTIILIGQGPGDVLAGFAQRLQLATPLVKETNPRGGLQLPASWPAVVQLAATFGAAWRPGPVLTAWITEQIRSRTVRPGGLSVTPPPGMAPYPWQVQAAAMIRENGSALIFDEPGTGKTASTILGLVERAAAGHEVLPAIVVCPAAVIDTWVEHVRSWAPRWRATAWRGTPDQRRRKAGTADVYVCSYDTARRDAKVANTRKEGSALFLLGARTIVADEVHKIKGQTTSQSQAVRRLTDKASHFVGLSGTPITHHPGDLWPALVCLEPGAWPSRERWVGRYCLTVQGDYSSTVLGLNAHTEPEFRTTLLGRHRRVAKADVLDQLPPKVYSVRTVDLPPAWRKVYDEMESDMLAQLPDGGELSVMGVLAQLTRLAQLASAAADVETRTEIVEVDGLSVEKLHTTVRLKAPSWKVDALLEVMDERVPSPVVAFAPSRQLMMLAGAAAAKSGRKVGYVVGGQTAKERTGYVDAFQRGELDLMCATTGAGGVGLTLTAARTAVFLQRPYSLVEALQSEDRCFGAGTPVLTPDGWRSIEDIAIGDEVVTHTGAAQPVIDAWSQQTKSGTLMADVAITGQETVTCTGDHRFLLRDGEWREAQDLRPGDWLAVPGNDTTTELLSLPFDAHRVPATFINRWGSEQENGRLKRADAQIDATDDFLFTLGYYAGDGFASIGDDKGRFISLSGNTERKVTAVARCARWAAAVGMTGANRVGPGLRTEQRFYASDWAHWFHEQFGGQTGARHKRLPAFVLKLNRRQSQLVLDGLAASDGYRRNDKPRVEYVTVSPVLAANVAQLATRAGHRPGLTQGTTGQLVVAFGGGEGPRNAGRVRSVLLRHPAKPKGVRERVYDLTVKDDETFVVGGVVVHNCHRIGAERHESIEVIDIVARKTIDSRVRAILRERAGQLSDLVQDPRVVAELLGGAEVRDLRRRAS